MLTTVVSLGRMSIGLSVTMHEPHLQGLDLLHGVAY